MNVYLVGGAVRDRLLGLPVKDRDWVVVGATPDEMRSAGYLQVGKGFPVFLHPQSKEEYALARTERKIAPGHTGFEIYSTPDVTLEEDLRRRDLTINAIAETEDGEIIDPYGGVADLDSKTLRHVSMAFVEDPLRILRVARFAARFAHLGFTVAPETMDLMRTMVSGGELESLVGERVWQEIERALGEPQPDEFVRVLRECHALAIILPEVDALFGVPQPAQYHPEIDTGRHILLCLQQARKRSDDTAVLWATLVHDVGKGITDREHWPHHTRHELLGLHLLSRIEDRLPVPKAHASLARLVCEHHTKLHRVQTLRPKTLLNLLLALDALRRPERLRQFLLACEADARGRTGLEHRDYPQGAFLERLLQALRAIDIPAQLADNPGADPKQLIERIRLQAIAATLKEIESHG